MSSSEQGTKFSLVIPTYNRAHLVGATLESVFSQTYQNYEIIIVDDGSSDDTVKVVRQYGDRVQLFQRDHAGCAAARNYGVQRASGEYVIFLDSDDLWFPWSLATYAQGIADYDQPSIVAGQLIKFEDASELDSITHDPMSVRRYGDYFVGAAETQFFLGTGVCAIRKDALDRVGGCTEIDTAATDSDLLFRLGVEPGFIKIDSPIVLGYRSHGSNILKDYRKAAGGADLLLDSEKQGKYPGGRAYRSLRDAQIGTRARALSLKLLTNGFVKPACSIYLRSLSINFRLRKWPYLFAFPIMVLVPPLRRERK